MHEMKKMHAGCRAADIIYFKRAAFVSEVSSERSECRRAHVSLDNTALRFSLSAEVDGYVCEHHCLSPSHVNSITAFGQ